MIERIAVVLLVVFAGSSFGQNCIEYGAATTVTRTFWLRDEAGHNQFIVLKLVRAVCTVADPKDVTAPAA